MEVDSEDQKRGVKTPLWQEYSEILGTENNNSRQLLGSYSRAAFYEESLKAQLIVLTGESAPYANLMLYKGVLN
jgi:L-fucose mutarotase